MDKRTGNPALVLSAVLLTGCSTTPGWLPGEVREIVTPESVEATGISLYLQNMHSLATEKPDQQRKVFDTISKRADRSPTTTNRLGLALALATSGHPATDIGAGREMLRALLRDPALLLDTERQLAATFLNEIEARENLLGASAARESESTRAAAAERERLTQLLAATRADNEKLKQELLEAEEKLRAITSIERSIRERADDEIDP